VGFNAIYHLTDVPSFVSGEHLVGGAAYTAALQRQLCNFHSAALAAASYTVADVPAIMNACMALHCARAAAGQQQEGFASCNSAIALVCKLAHAGDL
jgi:hypothetical protein